MSDISTHKAAALAQTAFGAGRLHARMSRAVMRLELADLRARAAAAATPEDVYTHTLAAERLACKLAARNAFAGLTVPMDCVFGTARGRTEFTHVSVEGGDPLDALLNQADLGARHIAHHFGDEGLVGTLSYAVFWGGIGVTAAAAGTGGAVAGTVLGACCCAGEGGKGCVGGTLGGLAVGAAGAALVLGLLIVPLGQLSALPAAGVKSLGSGVGDLYAGMVAKRRARKAAAAFKAPSVPVAATPGVPTPPATAAAALPAEV